MTTAADGSARRADPVGRVLLGLAALAVAFSAADTYVVVLALPDMMAGAGLSVEQLQRAAPILSGFMLGYVAALPLVGRIVDVRGRIPVLVGSLVVFSLGSLVTASAYDLSSMVTGRVLQGIGGGGLLPATLALVGAMYPPQQRGIPLGIVGAVQELGNVVGPLYGAIVLSFGSWRDIFWINLAAALVLAAVIRVAGRGREPARLRSDVVGAVLAAGALAVLVLLLRRPEALVEDVVLGAPFVPVAGDSRWLSPLAAAGLVLLLLLVWRCLAAARPLLDLRAWAEVGRAVDALGALLLTAALAGVILAFSTADPQVQVFAPEGPWLLAGSAVAGAGFWWRNRSVSTPLVPAGAVAQTPAWGAMLVSFFVGAALIAALVDIPIFARITIYGDSQVSAAFVLVRFLVGLPTGAFVGGWLTKHLPPGVVTAVGMVVAGAGFVLMSRWGLEALRGPLATVALLLGGSGIGLAMAPVNAALLSATEAGVHGVASGLLIVARTTGKLVGISVLTTLGLRRYYAAERALPSPTQVCSGGRTRCPEFTTMLRETGLVQLHTIFLGAAVCCVLAGLCALVVFRHAHTRQVRTGWGTGAV